MPVLAGDLRVRIEGVYDRVDARATEFAQRFDTRAFHDLGALLCSDAGTVLITTPPSSHYALIKACLLAGMNLVCEKPLALTRIDAYEGQLEQRTEQPAHMSQALHTLDPEQVAAALQNVMLDMQGLTPPEQALARIQARPQGDQLLRAASPLDALTRLSDAFDRVMEGTPNRHVTLDATMPVDELADKAFSALQHYNVHLAAG